MQHLLFVLDDLFDDQFEVLIFFLTFILKKGLDIIFFFISMKKLVLNIIYFHCLNLPFLLMVNRKQVQDC